MKKIIINIALFIVSVLAILALCYFVNGSLEMYPTEEQQEKIRIVSMAIFVFCIFVDCGLVMLRRRCCTKDE